MLKGRYEPGAVAAVITNSVNIDVVIWVSGLIIDLEINLAPQIGAEGSREPLNRGGICTRSYLPDTFRGSRLLVLQHNWVRRRGADGSSSGGGSRSGGSSRRTLSGAAR